MNKNIVCILIYTICTNVYGQEKMPSKNDFFDAVAYNNIIGVKRYITMNIDVNCQDHNGNTALHIAFKSRDTKNSNKIIEILLNNNIDKSIKNNRGEIAYKKTTYLKKLLYRFNNSLHSSSQKKSHNKDDHNIFAAEEYSLQYQKNKKNHLP